MLLRLSEPVSTVEPKDVVVPEGQVWVSPAGNFVVGFSFLEEDCSRDVGQLRCAATRRTLFAFRKAEEAYVHPDQELTAPPPSREDILAWAREDRLRRGGVAKFDQSRLEREVTATQRMAGVEVRPSWFKR